MRELVERAVKFRLHVVGQQFRQQPDEFQAIKALLQQSGSLGEWGFVISESEYRRLLRCSHLVISTALHDFQGLSVLEAVASGCVPLLPRRQAYPEWFGEEACYSSNIGSPEREAQSLADRVEQFAGEFYAGQQGALAPQLSHFSWQHLHGQYEALFKQVVDVTDMPFPVS